MIGVGQGNDLVQKVSCTMLNFHEWLNATYGEDALDLGDNDSGLFFSRLQNFSKIDKDAINNNAVGFDEEGELVYFLLSFTLTLKFFQPEQIKGPIFDLLDDWYEAKINDVNNPVPEELEGWFTAGFDQAWMQTERGIVIGMFQGLAISLPTAFLVVLYSTSNFLIASLAVMTIICIVSFVLSVAYFMGWALGIGEAIATVMVIGLSVDYTIHLGKVYSHAHEEGHIKKSDRFAYTMELMGETVLSATLTTAGSSAVMFGCAMAFFSKMATLIVSTIFASAAYALLFFMPLLLLLSTDDPSCCVISCLACKKDKVDRESAAVLATSV